MFYYIRGNVALVGEDFVVLDSHDVGYKIFTSELSISDIRAKDSDKFTLYTIMIHREEDMSIYGFTSQEELKLFQMLITVTGVGARLALGILSSISYDELACMIITEDINGLIKAQGVGKKTAQRIVLELKDKVHKHLSITNLHNTNKISLVNSPMEETMGALMALGYSRVEAEKAVVSANEEGLELENLLKKSLRYLSGK